jgi:superoxide dismutase, Cu-Zn family
LTNGCTSSGGHFNPFGLNHGSPKEKERHVGDFGNIVAEKNGVASFKFEDSLATLFGENTILGRTVVVHADEDDLGKGGFEDSLKTGHAGARVACGIIGIAQ